MSEFCKNTLVCVFSILNLLVVVVSFILKPATSNLLKTLLQDPEPIVVPLPSVTVTLFIFTVPKGPLIEPLGFEKKKPSLAPAPVKFVPIAYK